ncbi:hypothetical protein [Rhizobium sp. ZX09]|uniref:hypothetical protein n=1 Tax=Rhizobium sp. ZX09 TaxID=2291939 RepID=UPI001FF071E6|nr:hypothetical protein [Rhizobium sp. ZX09]
MSSPAISAHCATGNLRLITAFPLTSIRVGSRRTSDVGVNDGVEAIIRCGQHWRSSAETGMQIGKRRAKVPMRIDFLLWLGGAMATFLGAATASRAYIATNSTLVLLLSLALYCAGNLIMVRLMREGGMGLAISVSAVAQLLLVNVIAYFVFDERLAPSQMVGAGLGLIAMMLLLFPIGQR